MTESFETFSLHVIRHYAKLAALNGWRDYVRQQVRDMERDHPEAWRDLEKKVLAEVERAKA